MKKPRILILCIVCIMVLSCSSSDSGNDNSNVLACYDCTVNLEGNEEPTEYCDNGDGTYDVTSGEVTKTQSLDGLSFASFIVLVQQEGTCTRQ